MKTTTYTCDVCGQKSPKSMAPVRVSVFHATLCLPEESLNHEHVCPECGKAIVEEIKNSVDRIIYARWGCNKENGGVA